MTCSASPGLRHFTITKAAGYVYAVTAAKGETEKTDVTVTDHGDGTYTIPAAAIDRCERYGKCG